LLSGQHPQNNKYDAAFPKIYRYLNVFAKIAKYDPNIRQITTTRKRNKTLTENLLSEILSIPIPRILFPGKLDLVLASAHLSHTGRNLGLPVDKIRAQSFNALNS